MYRLWSRGSRRVRAFWGESVTESKRGQTASQARDGLGHYGLNRVLVEPATRLDPSANCPNRQDPAAGVAESLMKGPRHLIRTA